MSLGKVFDLGLGMDMAHPTPIQSIVIPSYWYDNCIRCLLSTNLLKACYLVKELEENRANSI